MSTVTPMEDETFDELASRINDLCRTASLDLAFHVGELVVKEVFAGDMDAWLERGTRSTSYRRLAQRPDLLMSASALCRAVGIYVLCERLGGRSRWRHLTASHLQEVLPLPRAQQERLLRVAEAERWPVARLRMEASTRRSTRDRPRRHAAPRIVTRVKTLLARIDANSLRALDPGQIASLGDLIGDIHAQLAELEIALGRGQEVSPSERRLKATAARG